MKTINQQNRQNSHVHSQSQIQSPQHSVISFWLFTNYPLARDFELNFVYQDQSRIQPFKSTKKLKELKSTIVWCQFDTDVPQSWTLVFSDHRREYLNVTCCFNYGDHKSSNPHQRILNIEDYSLTKPTIIFQFAQNPSDQNKNDTHNLIHQVIDQSVSSNQQNHLKEFLIQYKTQSVLDSKIRNEQYLAQFLDPIDKMPFESFIYRYVALEFFDLEKISSLNIICRKLTQIRKHFCNVCLNFNFLMSFWEIQKVPNSILRLTAQLVVRLLSLNEDGLLLRDIVEKYHTLPQNDPQSKSLMKMKPYIFKELKKLESSKPKTLSFPEIVFLFDSEKDSNEVLVRWTEDIDSLLKLMNFSNQYNLNDEFYLAIGKQLICIFESNKHFLSSNERIISFFEIMNTFDNTKFELIVGTSNLSDYIVDIIGYACERCDLFAIVCCYFAKYGRVLSNGLIATVLNSLPKDSHIQFTRLFKLSFDDPDLMNSLDEELKLIYDKNPLIIFHNFEEIYKVCQTYPQRNFIQKIFDMIGMNLHNFKHEGLKQFRENIFNEEIIRDAVESMIKYQIEFCNFSAKNRKMIINEIQYAAKQKQNKTSKNDNFINYILNKIQNHLKIEDPIMAVKLIFEDLNQAMIEDVIFMIDSSKNDHLSNLRSLLVKEFDDLAKGRYTVERFIKFLLDYRENSGLKRLHRLLHPQSDFKVYPIENYQQALQKLSTIGIILKNWCEKCPDYGDIRSEIDNLKENNKSKSVIQFIEAANNYMNDIDWNRMSILNRDITFLDMFNLNEKKEHKMTCSDRLHQILGELNKSNSTVKDIEKSFRSMTLDKVKEKLSVQNENDFDQFIQCFFSNEESKNSLLSCAKMIKNHSSLVTYLDIHEGIRTQLNLQMKDQEIKKELIARIKKLDPKTSVLGDFEETAHELRRSFDDFEEVECLSEKLSFVIGFKDPLKLLNERRDQFDRLKESVTDFKEFEITWNNINDLEILQSFFEELKKESERKHGGCFDNLGHFERVFDEMTKRESYKDIQFKIDEFIQNYNQYNLFFEQSSNASHSLKEWIPSFKNNSLLTIDMSKRPLKIIVRILNERGSQSREYSFDELEEKRDIILMRGKPDYNEAVARIQKNGLKSDFDSQVESEVVRNQSVFVEFFRHLKDLNELVEQMKNHGHDFTNVENQLPIKDADFGPLEDSVKELEMKYHSFKEQVSKAYERQFLFTFLCHEMIHRLVVCLRESDEVVQNSHLLNYLGFSDHKTVRSHFKESMPEIDPEFICRDMEKLFSQKLANVSSFHELQALTPKRQLCSDQFYTVKIPKRNNKNAVYRTILGVSIVANNRLPRFHNVLFCSPSVVSIKLQAFINRVYNCPNNQAFMIVHPECLSHDNQQEMIRLVHEIDKRKRRKAHLFVLYVEASSALVMYFLEQKKTAELKLDESVFVGGIGEEVDKMNQNVSVVVSGRPMVGKTTWIVRESKSKHKDSKIVHLRLTGVIDSASCEAIFNTLFESIDREQMLIHVDIGPVHSKSTSTVDQFLFSLVFLRTFETMNRVIVLPKDTKLFLEFDSSMTPRNGKQSIEFFEFNFNKIDKFENGINQLIPVSDVSLLFFQSFIHRNLNRWNGHYLESLLDIPANAKLLKTAQINVGLDGSQPQLKVKNPFDDSLKNQFFKYLQSQKEGNVSEDMLVHQLIFQRVLHFITYNYSHCGVLIDLQTSFEDAPIEMAELIFNSAKYLTSSSFNSLQLQQTAQTHMFANRSVVDDSMSLTKEKVQRWNAENTIFITFNEGYPIIVFTKKSLIPRCIRESAEQFGFDIRFRDIGDQNSRQIMTKEKHDIHDEFFSELAHLNPKLNVCKFCHLCCSKYSPRDCPDCENEGMSAADYWSENQDSNHVKQIINGIPVVRGKKDIKEIHKIEALCSYLKNLFGEETANRMNTNNEKQIVCLVCKRLVIDKCKKCSNVLMTAHRYFELNKDNEVFQKIHNRNLKTNRLKPFDPKSLRRYHVFDSDINQAFISHISRSLYKHYVLTLDNYSKILQIHVRAKSRLPIVIMGETGCGKTSLIRFMCRYVLDDHFEFYSMHAGTYESHVIEKVSQFFDKCESTPKQDCWMLFDEFNTSDAIGLIKTLMVDRRLGNRTAPVNAIFVATCNPFKVKKTRLMREHLVGLKRNLQETRAEQTSLVYNVHPLPESLFHFTFDFGQLSEEDEKQYAESILNRSLGQLTGMDIGSRDKNTESHQQSTNIRKHDIQLKDFDLKKTSDQKEIREHPFPFTSKQTKREETLEDRVQNERIQTREEREDNMTREEREDNMTKEEREDNMTKEEREDNMTREEREDNRTKEEREDNRTKEEREDNRTKEEREDNRTKETHQINNRMVNGSNPFSKVETQSISRPLSFDESKKESKVISSVCIEISQYLKSEFDLSSTSLRDVRRFEILLSFFKKRYFPAIQKVEKQDTETPESTSNKCLVMSVMVCYSLRLTDNHQREKVMEIVHKHAKIHRNDFLLIVRNETERLLRQFRLDKSVIKNKALSENLLSMFVCLLNKIPLIIIGKPGSSKSLSLQLLFQRMKGPKSSERFFREFEELAMVSHQGSEYSTSESIESLFQRAEALSKSNGTGGGRLSNDRPERQAQCNQGRDGVCNGGREGVLQSSNDGHGRIPVVVIDEIGLAELSKNSPLKVLHSRLEMEDVKVGFVGISNWYLDSSKMNRVLTVSRKDPDEEELTLTAIEMSNSALKGTPLIQKCFGSLAKVYWTHKRDIEARGEKNQGVAGLRDFYHLISQTVREYRASGPNHHSLSKDAITRELIKAAVYSIRRNFSYNLKYCDEMCSLMTREMGVDRETAFPEYNTNELLLGNLTDPKSRPLMVITSQEEVHNRVYKLLARPSQCGEVRNRAHRVLIGSRFENDVDSEEYCVELTSKVIKFMDQDIILFMHQLEAVYTSLYDLFNQNFKRGGDRNYCRIVQGTSSKCLYPVHENFKVVLFLSKDQLDFADEPLVNRFEKYSLTTNDFTTASDERKIKKVRRVFDVIFATKSEEERSLRGKQVFGNFTEMSYFRWMEKIEGFKSEDIGSDPILVEMIQMMRETSSLHLARHLFNNNAIRQTESFLEDFLNFKKRTVVDAIKELTHADKSTKTIVYTFSSIFENIVHKIGNDFIAKMRERDILADSDKKSLLENGEFFQNFVANDKINELLLSTIKSERAFNDTFRKFLENKKSVLMFIKVNGSNEAHHMFYLQNGISNMLNDYKDVNKHVIVCVYYKQMTITGVQSFPVSTDWKEMFIDDIFSGLDETTKNIMMKPDIISTVNLSNNRLKREFDGMVDKIIFDRHIKGSNDDYLNRITGYFKDFTQKYGEDFKESLIEKIFKAISEEKCPQDKFANDKSFQVPETIYDFVDKEFDILHKSESFVQRIESVINKTFESKLKNLIDMLLKTGIPGSMLFAISNNLERHQVTIKEIIKRVITSKRINDSVAFDASEPQCSLMHPCSHMEYQRIMSIDREQFGDDDSVVTLVFNHYKSLSFFVAIGYDIEHFRASRLAYIVIDLIVLHLTSKNIECPPPALLLVVFEKLISRQVSDIFKLFVFDPDLASNLCLLLSHLISILKTSNNPNSEDLIQSIGQGSSELNDSQARLDTEFSYQKSMESFQNLINTLIGKAFAQSTLASNLSNLTSKYSELKQSIDSFQESTGIRVSKSDSFDLLFMVGDLVDQSCVDDSLIHKLVNSNYDLLNRLEARDFTSTISQLKRILPGCSYEKLIEQRLLTFEVLYFQKQIEASIDCGDKENVSFIFEKVFQRIEECEDFALLANSIVKSLIKECRLKKTIFSFFENNRKFDENNKANCGEWLEDSLRKYPKRLPYLMISCLTLEVKSVLKKISGVQLSQSLKCILDCLTNYDRVDIVFNKTTLIHLTVIQYFTNDFSDAKVGGEKRDSATSESLSQFLNGNSRPAKSLQLYVCKNMKKIHQYNSQQLDEFLRTSDDDWSKELRKEMQTEVRRDRNEISLSRESYCFNADSHYTILNEIFNFTEVSDSLDLMGLLNYLKANNDENSLLVFYSLVINNFYFKRRSRESAIKRILTGIQKLKPEFSDCLGDMGYAFVEKVLSNFHSSGSLSLTEGSEKSIVQRNSSILFAFASILCHRNNKNHFSHLMFGCAPKEYFSHLKNCYLPGMILPPNPTVELMVSFLESLKLNWTNDAGYESYQRSKRIWKCSQDCDFFFIFANCGQPNLQTLKLVCPVCKKREIGAVKEHVVFDYHIPFTKVNGESYVNNCIQKYKKSYSKGYFNVLNSISDATGDGLNVSTLTTNALNFLTNSMILVLSELNVAEDKISDLVSVDRPDQFLLHKIAENFKKCKSKFPLTEVSVFMNLLSAKIASGLTNHDSINSVASYYEFEKKIDSELLSGVFSDDQKHYKEYCLNLSKSSSSSEPKDTMAAYMEEMNRDDCGRFPLVSHLRLESPFLPTTFFVENFTSVPSNKLKYPNTHFVLSHLEDLESLKVILAYKEFYDDFRRKFNGTLSRTQAENESVKNCSLRRTNPDTLRKLDSFIDVWNKWVKDGNDLQYECKRIKLSKIRDEGPLTQVLPNRLRGDSGTDILFGISSIIRIQNQMLRVSRPITKGIPVGHSWEAIDRKSVFHLDQEELNDEMNLNCLLTYIDYGRYGATKVDFDKFEHVLKTQLQRLKFFKDDEGLVPQFDYKYEIGKLTSILASLNNSGQQRPLKEDSKTHIQQVLQEARSCSQTCPYAQIFEFCQNLLLPRATLSLTQSIGATSDQLVTEFVQNTISDGLWKKLTFLRCFETLKMNQLSSFLLLIEILLFKENFGDDSTIMTRLVTDQKDKEWESVIGKESPVGLFKTEKCAWNLKDNWSAIRDALMRLVLRTSFNNDSLEVEMDYFIKNPTLFDLDYDLDRLDEFSLKETLKLKHCLLLLKSLEKYFKDHKPTGEIQRRNDFGTRTGRLVSRYTSV